MLPRFVVVPAVPKETRSVRNGTRYYATTVTGGFDIYDNLEKQRLKPSFQSKAEAEAECESRNSDPNCRHSVFPRLRTI